MRKTRSEENTHTGGQDGAGVMGAEYARERERAPALRFRLAVRAEIVVRAARRNLGRDRGLRVLDMGCAEGRTLRYLSGRLKNSIFLGVEYSPELLGMAEPLPGNINLRHGDVQALPEDIEEASFDLVSALAVLEHLGDPAAAVREAYRMLKPGGLFVATSPISLWDGLAGRFGLLDGEHHCSDMTQARLRDIAGAAGMESLDYHRVMFAPVAFLPYLRVPVSPGVSLGIDRRVERLRILNWLFVNQAIVAARPK